jgi:methylenetetrahydrofolate reductase (NADPH)
MLARLMGRAYIEVIPTRTIVDRLVHIPRHSYVSITCSPVHGIEPTLAMTEELCALPEERRLRVVPHIAARVVRDKGHLREILARLDDLKIESAFVPGGDAPRPLGDYDNSLTLLRDMADIGHGIRDIGIASHPEGHPLVDDAELVHLLQVKQAFANYLVTQMCFDAGVLVRWLRGIREAGVRLPAWIGLPGVAEIPKLISLSLKIGVGQSVSVLRKQKGLVRKMVRGRPYQPDDLLEGLSTHLDDPGLDIQGFHLFSFNNVEATEQWRTETLNRLNGNGK